MKTHFCATLLVLGITCNAMATEIKKGIQTVNAPAPLGIYSQAIQFGKITYISGQIGVDPKKGELVQGHFTNQLRQTFENITEIIKTVGGSMDNILKLTIYLTDIANISEVNNVMKDYFHQPYPARTVIEIKKLPKNALVEIETIMGNSNN